MKLIIKLNETLLQKRGVFFVTYVWQIKIKALDLSDKRKRFFDILV